ncbi:transcriptional regulator, MarR family [Jannaschia faecimaris]|uniref:Transcriptional regulator, MarR family n=1 Tax=Jannaschia faecimaris TaxID=1244108 RepID=A0A1H3QI53_9RHOB|nr:MarR family winged helix-turn-helix transcriptional regulator [Jannaschia faecimaris]SDZ12973.1 transcriptional regulator, MarR family [Jannaschia faecimaris]
MVKPDDQTTSAWISLARAYDSTYSAIEEALKGNRLPPLTWYDVLLELERADPNGLRPFELQESLLLPQYGISRLISRIEKEGYLQTIDCEDDKRGKQLKITESGKEIRMLMWRVYGDILQKVIGERLTSDQASQLSKLLGELSKRGSQTE